MAVISINTNIGGDIDFGRTPAIGQDVVFTNTVANPAFDMNLMIDDSNLYTRQDLLDAIERIKLAVSVSDFPLPATPLV